MRELKFRGQYIASGQMVTGGGIDTKRDTPLIINQGNRYHVIDHTIGQFTGLQDKNGVDIYEGDIIKKPNGVWGVIIWKSPSFEVTIDSEQSSLYSLAYFEDVEVIGNIHQNPELLEGNK